MTALPASLSAALADRYQLVRVLGEGGMATVYLATDHKHGRDVALKVFHADRALAMGAERFRREITIAARLQHPRILPVFDSGEAAGFLWYTMPCVDGESLRDLLQRHGRLPVAEALRITRDVADALAYAHAAGVVHRDIKPENILLSHGHALVADFGIARAAYADLPDDASGRGTALTVAGLSVGTPAYMSPEQATGETRLTGQSDLYSLACVCYEMLTGAPPHAAASPIDMLTRRVTSPPPSAASQRDDVPAFLDRALTQALATLPDQRTASVTDFLAALHQADAPVAMDLAATSAIPSVTGTVPSNPSAMAPSTSPHASSAASSRSAARRWAVVGVAGLLLLTGTGWWLWRTPPADRGALAQAGALLAKRTPDAASAALAIYDRLLASDSTDAAALAGAGYTYALFVDWGWAYRGLTPAQLRARALELSGKALAADSTAHHAWLTRAYVLTADDPYHLTGAVDAFARAMALDSTDAEGWYQYGQALMNLGDDAQAEAAYRRAAALDAQRPMPLMSLAGMALLAGKLAEAKALIDQAVARSPQVISPYVRVLRGRIALLRGDLRSARDDADVALAMDSTFTIPARALLADVLWASGDRSGADLATRQLLRDAGTGDVSPTVSYFVALTLTRQRRFDEAVSMVERARPRGAGLWFYLRSHEFTPLQALPRFQAVLQAANPARRS